MRLSKTMLHFYSKNQFIDHADIRTMRSVMDL